MNSRLDTIQAAVLLPKLKALKDYEIDRRQEVAGRYNAAFGKDFTVPFVAEGASPPGPSMPFWLRIPRPGTGSSPI